MTASIYEPLATDDIRIAYRGELMENYFAESNIRRAQGIQVIKVIQCN